MILLPLYWGAKNTLGRSFNSTACCIIMPPTLKKWGAYCFWLVRPSVHVCVHLFKKKIKARVLKFHIWIPHQNSLVVFFSYPNCLPLPSYAPFKGLECSFVRKISKSITARSFKLGQLIEDDE